MDLRKLLPPPTPPVLPYALVLDLLERAATKPLFGQPKITYPRLIAVQLRAYELGAIVGYVYHDALDKIALTFMSPGYEPAGLLGDLRANADERVSSFNSRQLLADDLLTFFVMTELEKTGTPITSLTAWQGKQVDVRYAYQLSFIRFTEGLALGGAYMERFRSMWRQTWEQPDDEVWATWRAFGLPLDKPSATIKFEDRCTDLQGVVDMILRHDFPQIELRRTGKKRTPKK